MSCPTCDHTLARLTVHEDMDFFHCERCGTVVVEPIQPGAFKPRMYRPKLVTRCREFEEVLRGNDPARLSFHWKQIGVRDSISTVDDRPAM